MFCLYSAAASQECVRARTPDPLQKCARHGLHHASKVVAALVLSAGMAAITQVAHAAALPSSDCFPSGALPCFLARISVVTSNQEQFSATPVSLSLSGINGTNTGSAFAVAGVGSVGSRTSVNAAFNSQTGGQSTAAYEDAGS